MTSGRDWTDRMKRLEGRAGALNIFSQRLIVREPGEWLITEKGRAFLSGLERPAVEQRGPTLDAPIEHSSTPNVSSFQRRRSGALTIAGGATSAAAVPTVPTCRSRLRHPTPVRADRHDRALFVIPVPANSHEGQRAWSSGTILGRGVLRHGNIIVPRRPIVGQPGMRGTLCLMVAAALVGIWLCTDHDTPTALDV